jgi:hypothetical protein
MILLELTQVLPASAMPSPHWSWELVADFAGALRAGLPCSFLRPVVWDPFPCWLGTGESFPGQRSDVPCLKAQGDWARCSMVFVGCWLLLVPSPLFLSEAPPPHWFWLWLWATPCASMFRGTGPRTGSSLPVTWGGACDWSSLHSVSLWTAALLSSTHWASGSACVLRAGRLLLPEVWGAGFKGLSPLPALCHGLSPQP